MKNHCGKIRVAESIGGKKKWHGQLKKIWEYY
jgi:hypothetical protein